MRNRDTIDAELRVVASVRRAMSDVGGPMPSTDVLNELLDERNGDPLDPCPARYDVAAR